LDTRPKDTGKKIKTIMSYKNLEILANGKGSID
jgi:hypothetical protein